MSMAQSCFTPCFCWCRAFCRLRVLTDANLDFNLPVQSDDAGATPRPRAELSRWYNRRMKARFVNFFTDSCCKSRFGDCKPVGFRS